METLTVQVSIEWERLFSTTTFAIQHSVSQTISNGYQTNFIVVVDLIFLINKNSHYRKCPRDVIIVVTAKGMYSYSSAK